MDGHITYGTEWPPLPESAQADSVQRRVRGERSIPHQRGRKQNLKNKRRANKRLRRMKDVTRRDVAALHAKDPLDK